jgi:hypothetical protein
VVFIVAKTPGGPLAMLVSKIDAIVAPQAPQQAKKLAAVVNFVGAATDKEREKIKKFGARYRLKRVPLTIITDGEDLKIDDAAEVTVMLYRDKKVKFNYSLAKGSLNQKTIAAIVQNAKKMLAMPDEPKKGAKSKEPPKPSEEPAPPIKKDSA